MFAALIGIVVEHLAAFAAVVPWLGIERVEHGLLAGAEGAAGDVSRHRHLQYPFQPQ